MAMPSFNQTKNLGKNGKKSNLDSSWAFLLSILVYISVFYIFNLSPSTLMHTTKFWFILSNTLILIIVVDSRSFSSSKQLHLIIDEYDVRPEVTPPYNFPIIKYDKTTSRHHHARVVDQQLPPEKIIRIVDADHTKPQQIIHHPKNNARIEDEKIDAQVKKMDEEDEEMALPTMSEKDKEASRLEESEFSRMSDEEVNKRVEEFIRRFNRQIRLQASRNRR